MPMEWFEMYKMSTSASVCLQAASLCHHSKAEMSTPKILIISLPSVDTLSTLGRLLVINEC